MADSSTETKKKLLESAKKEFLEKGFIGASLRTIAANAGVTTGAMYRHFKDKDAFFCALVDDVIDYVTSMVMLANTDNHQLFDQMSIKNHMTFENESAKSLINYMYDHFDAFTLLLYDKHVCLFFVWKLLLFQKPNKMSSSLGTLSQCPRQN